MISQPVDQYFQDHLRGIRSAEETREILALIDQASPNGGPLVAEFDNLLASVAKKIPGLTIDLEKLLNGDPIESDPLISQGNLALLRLDAVYHQTYAAWTTSGADLHRSKRITKAEDPAAYSQRTEKHERTEQNYPPDTQLLNQIVSITLSAFRIQATLTHRRNQLLTSPAACSASLARRASEGHPGRNQTAAISRADSSTSPVACSSREGAIDSPPNRSARPMLARRASEEIDPFSQTLLSASSAPPREKNPDIIDHTESLTDQLDDSFHPLEEIKPFEADFALIRGINKLSPLKGFAPLVEYPHPEHAPGTADVPVGILNPLTEIPIPFEPTHPRTKALAPTCTCSSKASSGANPATSSDLRTRHLREEEPVVPTRASKVPPSIPCFSIPNPSLCAASLRETIPLTNNEPNFHKRE